jgi:hypothetical protein
MPELKKRALDLGIEAKGSTPEEIQGAAERRYRQMG